MRAPSPVRQLASLGAIALVGFAALVLQAGVVEAGPGARARLRWEAPPDSTDSTRTADSLRAVAALAAGDTTLADSLLAALGVSGPGADTSGAVPEAVAGAALPADALFADPVARAAARSDSDSVAVARPGADSLGVAGVADTTRRALEYLPGTPLGGTSVSIMPRRLPGVRGRLGGYWTREVTLDSSAYAYTVREEVGGADVRAAAQLTLDEYLVAQRRATLADGFRSLAATRADRGRRRGGVGFTVDIPGGEQSAFRTLFGRNEVDLTVSGTSNVNLGLAYDQSDRQEAITGNSGIISPDFGQELNLNVAGTIGDKLRINVNYDTQSTFDFENQVSLVYTGYEDDIVQRIEAGNVFLQTPSELIQGGQRLFGLRTDLRFGPLALTAVASQQDAETSEIVIEGGSQATPFSIAPTEYENDTHFFLGYAFHNYWDRAHQQPGLRTLPGPTFGPGFRELVGIEVWKHEPNLQNTQTTTDEIITATALADLAEPREVLEGGEEYLADPAFGLDAPLPDSLLDFYSTDDLAEIRANEALDVDTRFGLPPGGSAGGLFRRLRENVDYTVDPQLGWLSLTTALSENDYLAVSYQYRLDDGTPSGRLVTVGDFGEGTRDINQRNVLKLLRADLPTPAAPLWDLTMRNVYRIGGRSLNPTAFTLRVTYEPPGGSPREEFADVVLGNSLTLLQVLGLDRVNEQGQIPPDNAFDFLPGLTVDADNGRVIFPVRQPFGDYLTQVFVEERDLSGQPLDVTPTTGTNADAAARYAFEPLYDLKPVQARQQFPALSKYRITGEFRSATQSVFNVGFNLVPGTVRVTSGGQDLTENQDYRVNYTAGTVEIVNPLFLQNGQQVRVQVEQNRLFAVGSTTLLGLRADYRLAENTTFGGTWMRLSQRPAGLDKFRVGEEPFDNTVLGFDGRYLAEPRWITRALDFLPLLQTRAPSRVELRGEIARLTPGHPQTLAFDQTLRRLNDEGLGLPPDEVSGLSFVDDFEGSENAYGVLGETAGWRLAAPPDSAGPANAVDPGGIQDPADVVNPLFPSNWRGLFAWYAITNTNYGDLADEGLLRGPATARVSLCELYRDRFPSCRGTDAQPIGLLDLYFDPTRRGPYNYNGDLAGAFAANPRTVWGGMVRQIDGAYSDFEGQNNIEFVEMLVAAVGGHDGNEDIQPGARMYIDLGRVNEDVVPNSVTSTEDGLRDGGVPADAELDAFGRRTSTGQPNGVVDFFRESGRTEDLGLDGLPSRIEDVAPNGEEYDLDERTHFQAFLGTALPAENGESARAGIDPSADDYHHFNDDNYFNDAGRFPARDGRPAGATAQERYAQYLPAVELNSFQSQTEIVQSGQPGISTTPNTEDVNGNLSVDFAEVYHRYEVPLDEAGLLNSPFFQNTIVPSSGEFEGQTFYLLRIPVRTENRSTSPGLGRDDFSRIETVRLWTTGHDQPATIRIASFELVGSQWLQSDRVGTAADLAGEVPPGPEPRLFVATINSDESPTTYAIPRQAIYRTTAQAAPGASSSGLAREQALVFRAETLADGRSAGVVRSYATRPLDLTRYSNVRLYVHGHGFERSDSLRVVVRLGDDETDNYYEYSQPVYPFELDEAARISDDDARADSLWQTATEDGRPDRNSVNIVLSELNKLKVSRDESGSALEAVYESESEPEGAPPGARIAVRGQPSIQDIRTVVLGVRNGVGGQVVPLDTVEVWFNELRVSGYDEASGASGFLTANIVMADVATVNARFSATQDGFGDLGGGLGGRDFSDRTALSLTSSFNAHRLLPERFGWSIPVSYSMTANESTPRYDPNRGDIRLDELV
ncbi:MAG TPA: cell surface protein SprA, partial [Rubricoccaceae bacterium]